MTNLNKPNTQSYIAKLTNFVEGREYDQDFILIDVPNTIVNQAVLCACLLCIWDNEHGADDRLENLDLNDADEVGYEVEKFVNDFRFGHAKVDDANDDTIEVDAINLLSDEKAKAYQVLSDELSTPCYTFFIFETMFNFFKTVNLNNGEESIDDLETANPLIFKLLNFYIEKLNDGAEQFDDAWLEEINTLLNA